MTTSTRGALHCAESEMWLADRQMKSLRREAFADAVLNPGTLIQTAASHISDPLSWLIEFCVWSSRLPQGPRRTA